MVNICISKYVLLLSYIAIDKKSKVIRIPDCLGPLTVETYRNTGKTLHITHTYINTSDTNFARKYSKQAGAGLCQDQSSANLLH